jgi:hypothetical protein
MAQGLTWKVTGLWHPSHTLLSDLAYYGQITDPINGEVDIPRNDSRTATVTVSEYDPIIPSVLGHTYARCLRVYYRDRLVFWGPIKTIEYNLDPDQPGTVKLNAVDPSIRLIQHYLVRGDLGGELSKASRDRGSVSVDHIGLRLLRDAGLNTAEQNTEDDPDLGIINGTNTFPAAVGDPMGVQRGDEVWSQMTQLSQSLGPDFELAPIADTVGAYCKLNTFEPAGLRCVRRGRISLRDGQAERGVGQLHRRHRVRHARPRPRQRPDLPLHRSQHRRRGGHRALRAVGRHRLQRQGQD